MFKFILIFSTIAAISLSNANASSWWTKETYSKQKKLMSIWYSEQLSREIIDRCKKTTTPVHCIRLAGSIGYNESSAWQNASNNNVFGKRVWNFLTTKHAVDWWVWVYERKWYKTKYNPSSFYSNSPKLPVTRYCVDERQLNGKMLPYCHNWYKHAWYAWNKLTF